MKYSISWHQENLKYKKEHYARLRNEIEADLAILVEGETACDFYEKQIKKAQQNGLTEFDRDRFTKLD